MSIVIGRPAADEYGPYYAGYIERVPEGDILATLGEQLPRLRDLLSGLGEEAAGAPWAPGEWTIKEIVGHLVDVERVFSYRAMRMARGDQLPLQTFDQGAYVQEARFNERGLRELLEELALLRQANLLMFQALSEEQTLRRGYASGVEFSVRGVIHALAGHFEHDVASMAQNYQL